MYITTTMKTQVHPQILVIQKISSVLIHGRDVETMLEKVLEIIDSEMGMRRGTFSLRYGDTLQIEASHGLTDAEKKSAMSAYKTYRSAAEKLFLLKWNLLIDRNFK